MKKVFNSCLGAVLLSSPFMMHLQKGSVNCISFIEVFLGLSLQLLFVVSLLTTVFGVSSLFKIVSSGGCFSVSLTVSVFLIPLLVVTALTMFITVGFVAFEFFWCFSGSSTICKRQSAALFLAPEIHSNVMLYEASSSPHLLILVFSFFPFKNCAKGLWSFLTMMSAPCR